MSIPERILFGLARAHPEARFPVLLSPAPLLPVPARHPARQLHAAVCSWKTCAPRRGTVPRAQPAAASQLAPAGRVATFHDLFVLTGDYSTPEFRRRFAGAGPRRGRIGPTSSSPFPNSPPARCAICWESSADRVRVIPHGASAPGAHPNQAPPAREKLILHVGAIQRRKNLVRLIEAFERTEPGWRLALAGSSDMVPRRSFAALRRQSPKGRMSRFSATCRRTQLDDLYARASVFAFPSLDEGFGMPILDAMAAGVPVLTSNRSATAEVSGDAALAGGAGRHRAASSTRYAA